MGHSTIMKSITDNLREDSIRHTNLVLSQLLGDLVGQGALIPEHGETRIFRMEGDPKKFEIKHDIKFELKEQEYIDRLKKKIAWLEGRLTLMPEER